MTHHGAIILMMLCLMLSAPLLTHAETHSGSAPETQAKTPLSDAGFNEGVRAVREKDYRKAYLIFQQHAESMQPDAQYNLALLLKSGKGSPQNFNSSWVKFDGFVTHWVSSCTKTFELSGFSSDIVLLRHF